jgi:hypothetical protein
LVVVVLEVSVGPSAGARVGAVEVVVAGGRVVVVGCADVVVRLVVVVVDGLGSRDEVVVVRGVVVAVVATARVAPDVPCCS